MIAFLLDASSSRTWRRAGPAGTGISGGGESLATPDSTTGGSEPARSPAAASSPTPTPKPRYPGFELDLSQGAFWEYRWYTDRSCAQGSGCSTDEDSGVFQVTLGGGARLKGFPSTR